jgi:PIN domain nuclease of toxin-antitoxin system
LRAGALPLLHRDPFDRMIVAQALVEGVPLLSSDGQLDPYGIWRLAP